MSVVVYVVASALFIGILLLSNGMDEFGARPRGEGGEMGPDGARDNTRLVPPKPRAAANRTGATVELLKLQQARGEKLQDRLLRYRIVDAHAHDSNAFTQGLEYIAGRLIESTGIVSTLREVEIKTGRVLRKHALSASHFGEGCTLLKGKVYQLTWQTHTCFVYDLESFEMLQQFKYDTIGWGLTNDGTQLIMTDGTSTLYFRDAATFDLVRTVVVKDPTTGKEVDALNELEFVHGEVLANIWFEDKVARINPGTGHVVGWIDLSGLHDRRSPMARGEDVLNGIAFDKDRDRLWVTGKLWPTLFEIELV